MLLGSATRAWVREDEEAAWVWVPHREEMWVVSTTSCLPVGEVRPLSQKSCRAASLQPSYCVGVQAWILWKEKIPSIPKATILESKSLLGLRDVSWTQTLGEGGRGGILGSQPSKEPKRSCIKRIGEGRVNYGWAQSKHPGV